MKKKWEKDIESIRIYHEMLAHHFLVNGRNEMRTAQAIARHLSELQDIKGLMTFFREDERAKSINHFQRSSILTVSCSDMVTAIYYD